MCKINVKVRSVQELAPARGGHISFFPSLQHSTNFRVNNFKDILADKENANDDNHKNNKDNGNDDFDDYKNYDNNDDDDVCIALAYFDRKLNRSQYTHCENY